MDETPKRAADDSEDEFDVTLPSRAANDEAATTDSTDLLSPTNSTSNLSASDVTEDYAVDVVDDMAEEDAYLSDEEPKKRRVVAWLFRSIVLILVLAIAGTSWYLYSHRNVGLDPDVPLWTPGEPARTPAPSISVPSGCVANPEPIDPVLFEIMDTQYSWEMMSLGWDSDHVAAAAPPLTKEDIRKVGWFNEGPWAGSAKGNVILTAHTMVGSIGVGNEINTGLLHEGDIVRLSDASGVGVCYQYTHAIKVYVKDYDPGSGILYDNDGPPRLALVACSSEDADTGQLSARIIYYLDLVGEPLPPASASPATPAPTP
ncbi:MAG: class F sortase [Propionibacteriaceae bacterium]|nr:class F sortase [Propionibacteriaceae bacterium]